MAYSSGQSTPLKIPPSVPKSCTEITRRGANLCGGVAALRGYFVRHNTCIYVRIYLIFELPIMLRCVGTLATPGLELVGGTSERLLDLTRRSVMGLPLG